MKGYVYILKNKNDRYYIGSTANFENRLKQHGSGSTQTTRDLKTFEPVFVREYANLAQARYIERRLKKLKRKDYLEKVISEGYIRMAPP